MSYNKKIALYCAGLAVLSVVGIMYVNTTIRDSSLSDETSCTNSALNKAIDPAKMKDGDACNVWDGSNCRKGQIAGLLCVAQGSKMMMFFLGLLAVSIIAAAFFFFKKDKSAVESNTPLPPYSFRPFRFSRSERY
jgi:hypothetical protein